MLKIAIFVLVCLAAFDLDAPAHAYLDPGTGAMMLQALLGGIAGALVFGKVFWARIKNFFRRSSDAVGSNDTTPSN